MKVRNLKFAQISGYLPASEYKGHFCHNKNKQCFEDKYLARNLTTSVIAFFSSQWRSRVYTSDLYSLREIFRILHDLSSSSPFTKGVYFLKQVFIWIIEMYCAHHRFFTLGFSHILIAVTVNNTDVLSTAVVYACLRWPDYFFFINILNFILALYPVWNSLTCVEYMYLYFISLTQFSLSKRQHENVGLEQLATQTPHLENFAHFKVKNSHISSQLIQISAAPRTSDTSF